MTDFVPWFEDFAVGDEFNEVPAVTITSGMTAMHQAVFADRGRLTLNQPLCKSVTGSDTLLVNPALVCNVAIGQSTIPSQRVMGNLFYRGLRLQSPVYVGDTLTTSTRVVALRQNSIKPGRAASGMVALEIQTLNQRGETVLHFWRCPMVPCRDPEADTGKADDFSMMPEHLGRDEILSGVPDWNLAPMSAVVKRRDYEPGQAIQVEARDTVTSAPEIVRMTLNMAMTHTDLSRSVYDKRLVYGGHTISIAASQLSRVVPGLVMILAWYKCDHVAPVFEDDILSSDITFGEITDNTSGEGKIADINISVSAHRGDKSDELVKVLDWQLAALLV